MSRVLHALLKRNVISNSNISYCKSFRQRFLQDDNDRMKCFPPRVEQIETFVPHDSSRLRRRDEASTPWGLRISTLCGPVIDVNQFLSKSKSLIRNKESDWRWRKICRQLHARIHDCRRCALRRSWGLIHRLCLQRTREKDVRCDKRWRNPSIRASTTRGSWWYATFCPVIKNRYATTSRMDIQDQREDQSQRYDISHIHNCH